MTRKSTSDFFRRKTKIQKKFYRKSFQESGINSAILLKYTAAILILAILSNGFYIANHPEKEIASLIHIENRGNQLKLIFLPDSSEIRLGPESMISYSKNYIQKRLISLQGGLATNQNNQNETYFYLFSFYSQPRL